MDLRVVHGANSLPGSMFVPRMDSRGELQFVDFRSREQENLSRADVRHKPFTQPVYRTAKDLDRRQTITQVDRHNGVNRPEFTSLSDVYEGALRNVLDIQLHLTLDDQQSFTQDAINDLLFRDKPSPGHHRGLRQDQRRRSENNQHDRQGAENKDMKNPGSFQGRTFLRDPRRVSPGGSAFHVPPKKARLDEDVPYPERGFPVDHYGIAPRMNFPPDYPNSFPSSKGPPGIYQRRVNAPEAAVTHVYGTNGIHIPSPRDRYSLWPFGHHRDIASVFPVRCSSVENDRRFHHGVLEEERRRNLDLARVNGFMHGKTVVQVKCEKETKDENVKRNQKPIPIERRSSSTPGKEAGLERGMEREKLSPSSPKLKPANASLTSYRSSPTNGAVDFRMETRYRTALRRLESKRDGKRGKAEDAKEEFLFKLGLERIEP